MMVVNPFKKLTQFLETVREETRNERDYAMEAKDLSIVSFIVNSSQPSTKRRVQLVTFTLDDVVNVHYPHCNALIVMAVVGQNSLKRMLVENGRSVNIMFGATFDKMEVDHELTPINSPFLVSLITTSSQKGKSLKEQRWGRHH